MSDYVIGDVHGCYASLLTLLDAIQFDEKTDRLWLCGDVVARGDHSLDVLRFVKHLATQGACQMVLGNHDITLIATWRGMIKRKDKDKTAQIFRAKDCDELLNWLRKQPLLLLPTDQTVLVHAGIPPVWTLKMAQQHAKKVQRFFAGSLDELDRMLPKLYDPSLKLGNFEKLDNGLPRGISDLAKLKLIMDYLTRMRLCRANGELDFTFKGSIQDTMPTGFKAWFDWHGAMASSGHKILFGHWAALEAKVATDAVQALDGGCVWGGQLLAYRLEDGAVVGVNCHR